MIDSAQYTTTFKIKSEIIKLTIPLILTALSMTGFAQPSQVVFWNNDLHQPVSNLPLRTKTKILYTNQQGSALVSENDLPIALPPGRFTINRIDSLTDTIRLTPIYQMLSEVSAAPVDLHQRNAELLEFNRDMIADALDDSVYAQLNRYVRACYGPDTILFQQTFYVLGTRRSRENYSWQVEVVQDVYQITEGAKFDTSRIISTLQLVPDIDDIYKEASLSSKRLNAKKKLKAKRSMDEIELMTFLQEEKVLGNIVFDEINVKYVDSVIREGEYASGFRYIVPKSGRNNNSMYIQHQYHKNENTSSPIPSVSVYKERWYQFSQKNGGYGTHDLDISFAQFVSWYTEPFELNNPMSWNQAKNLIQPSKGVLDFLFDME